MISLACSDLEKPRSEPYYAETAPPRKQEFRWSNGKAPKSLDPAMAATPPETDLVRAVFEGLTELNAATLEAVPAAAESWTSSEDFRTWTFTIRANARWSNGRPVTSEDFVRSWKRLGDLGDKIAHPDLLTNIVGFPFKKKPAVAPTTELLPTPGEQLSPPAPPPSVSEESAANTNASTAQSGPAPAEIGVSAVGPQTLRVLLLTGDKDFPKLVANPMFRPVAGEAPATIGTDVVTNGAFRITAADPTGVTLDRSETYWNREAVKLERVKLVAADSAEKALAAYRAGDIDAVTNANFEPLALKLLEPFDDFRRRPHAAINFYEINHEKPPFDDRRVREALAIAIERERLTEGEMEGQTQVALSFLPFARDTDSAIVQDKERARDLLDEAGFAGGQNFPVIKLVVNRNDTQQRIARAVARMWKQNLNIDTEILAKENAEVEAARLSGDFDLVRRNAVFPSADELMSILTILKPAAPPNTEAPSTPTAGGVEADATGAKKENGSDIVSPDVTMSEANAIYELWAIPLYFPTSYSLVKPYVNGFEMNSLDAPVLHEVSINSDWQPK
jgi:oligopeptide transport system substrate-binding protein